MKLFIFLSLFAILVGCQKGGGEDSSIQSPLSSDPTSTFKADPDLTFKSSGPCDDTAPFYDPRLKVGTTKMYTSVFLASDGSYPNRDFSYVEKIEAIDHANETTSKHFELRTSSSTFWSKSNCVRKTSSNSGVSYDREECESTSMSPNAKEFIESQKNINNESKYDFCWVKANEDSYESVEEAGYLTFSNGVKVLAYKTTYKEVGTIVCNRDEVETELGAGESLRVSIDSPEVPSFYGSSCRDSSSLFHFQETKTSSGEVVDLNRYEVTGVIL